MQLHRLVILSLLGVCGAVVLAAYPAVPANTTNSAGKPLSRLILGANAPEILAVTPDGKPATLAELRAEQSLPVVLQFASITDPIFRAHAPAVEKLAKKYASKVTFVVLYQREAHPADSPQALDLNIDDPAARGGSFNLSQPLNLDERVKLAQQTVDRLGLKNQTLLVDVWNNTSSLRYGSYPNMTFIVDAKGILQAGYPWMDPPRVQGALDALLAGTPIPLAYQGSVKLSASAPLDFTGAAMDMTGGRAASSIATALDKMNLSDQQKFTLYPALAEYLASLQEFRATLAAVPGRAGQAAPPVPPNNAPNAPKVATPEDAQKANDALHASAGKLKSLIHQTLSAQDATALLAALEQSQAQRLFATP